MIKWDKIAFLQIFRDSLKIYELNCILLDEAIKQKSSDKNVH